jgi:hypothetical protein
MAAFLCCWAPASTGAADEAAKSTSPNAAPDEEDRWLPTSNWEVLFDESEGLTALEYARRLDYFGIELAAVAKNGQVQYASHLAERKPERRIGKLEEEPRINLHWKRGTLAALEAKLLAKAGINTKDKTLTHFYPKAIEARLARLEKSYAGRDPRDIQRTLFKVRPLGNQPKAYEFYVDEQDAQETGSQSSQNSPAPAAPPPQKPKAAP